MAEKWQLPIDDPSLPIRPYEARLDAISNPRHRQLLEMLIEHIRCVVAGDVDGVMRTMVDEPHFVTWGPNGDLGSKGREAVYKKYSKVKAGGILNQTNTIEQLVVDDHTIALELTETRLLPWELARAHGYAITEERGQYAVHRHCAVIAIFDDSGLIIGENNYGFGWPPSPDDWEFVPDEEVSPTYRAWLRELAASA